MKPKWNGKTYDNILEHAKELAVMGGRGWGKTNMANIYMRRQLGIEKDEEYQQMVSDRIDEVYYDDVQKRNALLDWVESDV